MKGYHPYGEVPEGIREGDVFSELTVIKFVGRNSRYQARFLVKCACGSETEVLGSNLKQSKTLRCNSGIHRADHGMTNTPEYQAWKAMNWRVKSPRVAKYYHDKGIMVCAAWRDSFQAFLEHVGKMPSPRLTIDRINGNGDYEPGNVRWATRKEQMRNLKTNRLVTIGGRSLPLAQWAEIGGLSIGTLTFRVKRGWPETELLSKEFGRHRKGRCAQSV